MKTQVTIDTQDYQIEIKVKNLNDLNATNKNAKRILNYIVEMAFEAAENSKNKGLQTTSAEYRDFAFAIFKTLQDTGYYNESN